MAAEPINLYRLRCGDRVWTPWLTHEADVLQLACDKHLAHVDDRGLVYLGPLVWIERGIRQYVGRRTIPLDRNEKGEELVGRYRDPRRPPPSATHRWRSGFG